MKIYKDGEGGYIYVLGNHVVPREAFVFILGEDGVRIEEEMAGNPESAFSIDAIRKGYGHPAWKHMLDVFRSSGMPNCYLGDMFYHDAGRLAQYWPDRFVWFVRETGTWLVIPEVVDDYSVDDLARLCRKGKAYLYNRGEWRQIDEAQVREARAILAGSGNRTPAM